MYCPDTDNLTGILTREGFISRARNIPPGGMAVVWLNLDNFKMFNKRFGFDRGDELLREIAMILGSIFPSGDSNHDLLARFSDDNFVVLTDWAMVEVNIDTVQEYLYSLHENVTLRLRAGIYFPSDDDDIRIACDRAKLACDSIRKNHSVSSCMFHDGMSRELALQQYILDGFDAAISRGYITVLYQPIVRLSTERICGAEALARWNDPEAGIISPAKFIPTLEKK